MPASASAEALGALLRQHLRVVLDGSDDQPAGLVYCCPQPDAAGGGAAAATAAAACAPAAAEACWQALEATRR